MSALTRRSAQLQPLAPLGFGSHELDGVRFYFCKRNAFGQAYQIAG